MRCEHCAATEYGTDNRVVSVKKANEIFMFSPNVRRPRHFQPMDYPPPPTAGENHHFEIQNLMDGAGAPPSDSWRWECTREDTISVCLLEVMIPGLRCPDLVRSCGQGRGSVRVLSILFVIP